LYVLKFPMSNLDEKSIDVAFTSQWKSSLVIKTTSMELAQVRSQLEVQCTHALSCQLKRPRYIKRFIVAMMITYPTI